MWIIAPRRNVTVACESVTSRQNRDAEKRVPKWNVAPVSSACTNVLSALTWKRGSTV
jgi:hypothetical protein